MSLWQLRDLTKLYASYNQLARLPASFGQLLLVEELFLNDNQLTTLESVSKLTRLRVLNVSHNHLDALPVSLFCAYSKMLHSKYADTHCGFVCL